MRQNNLTEETSSNGLLTAVQNRLRQARDFLARMFNREPEYTQVPYRHESSSSEQMLLDFSGFEEKSNNESNIFNQYDYLIYQDKPISKLEQVIDQIRFFPKNNVSFELNQTQEIAPENNLIEFNS